MCVCNGDLRWYLFVGFMKILFLWVFDGMIWHDFRRVICFAFAWNYVAVSLVKGP